MSIGREEMRDEAALHQNATSQQFTDVHSERGRAHEGRTGERSKAPEDMTHELMRVASRRRHDPDE